MQDVALALFGTRGYDATSLQEIATTLAVTKAALYYHVPSKAALYYHVPSKAALLHSLADPFLDAESTLLDGYGTGPLDTTARQALLRAWCSYR